MAGNETRYVFDFAEGNKDQKDLLGGKGANLAEMVRLGLPVPPGFILTTEACTEYFTTGDFPPGLDEEISAHLAACEAAMGKTLGEPKDPLLLAVRSGAKFSMPGMMETVLNVGLNDDSVQGLATVAADPRFAWDSYRRLLQMFGSTVLGVDAEYFAEALGEQLLAQGVDKDQELSVASLQALVASYKAIIRIHAGRDFPQDPREQLDLAIRSVFDSWNTDRARLYRRQEKIPEDLGTAVNVLAMVFGNLGAGSGTGVAFTRDPATGNQGVYGDYLEDAQGEDVVAGIRNTLPLAALEAIDKDSHDQLLKIMDTLERHYLDMCDVEFTIERGKLWMLQTRVGKRTPEAAFKLAVRFVDEGLIDMDEALRRVSGEQLARLMFPGFEVDAAVDSLATGMGASPGAAVGKAVFDSATAVAWAQRGEDVILVRQETNPDDLHGMVVAKGILTSRGGKTSHAAVVARGMGRTCVCGADDLQVDVKGKCFSLPDGRRVNEGEVISIDGTSGEIFHGAIPFHDSIVVQHFEGADHEDSELVAAVARLMTHADRVRRLAVRANADTPEDAARARRFGAEGIGLCRTEHMFLGERRQLVEDLIVAADDAERDLALAALLPLQREDFERIFAAMDGLPVTIRLLDPPLHEFLPNLTELSVEVALAREQGAPDERLRRLLSEVQRLHEQNPMLGLRGVRLGIIIPGLFVMQARAIMEAAAAQSARGLTPRPEIMVPLVATADELAVIKSQVEAVADSVHQETGYACDYKIGTMIELPRAALTARQIAAHAEFFSFGTNDLTQMTWGFSRDDVEATFLPHYLDEGLLSASPFDSLDVIGVGELVRMGAERGRQSRPDLHLGVCGEHGGDPASIHFFEEVGLDYVSCSPFRAPVARLEAGRAVLLRKGA